MKNQKPETSPLKNILREQGLTGDIPPEIRADVSASMRKNYRTIIKRAGGLTVAASITGILFFFLKRVETWLPAAKVTLPAAIVSLATAATVVTTQLASPRIEPVLLIRTFKSASLNEGLVAKTGALIIEKINAMPGNIQVASHTGDRTTSTLPLIVGSMEQAGAGIYVTVKVIDPVTSRILFMTGTSAKGVDELESVSEKLAREIHGYGATLNKKKTD